MKNKMLFFLLMFSIITLIIRAFFPIPVDKSAETIDGINLLIDVLCGSFIVSIITFFIVSAYPLYKKTRTVKKIVRGKLKQLDLYKWIPGGVLFEKKNTFEEFMEEYGNNLMHIFNPLQVKNGCGLGIIENWKESVFQKLNEISLLVDYLDISFLESVEKTKNNEVFHEITSIKIAYNLGPQDCQEIKDWSLFLIKKIDEMNKDIKNLEKTL